MAAGYLTVHANPYARGWTTFLDRLILGRREGEGLHAMRLTTGETSVVFETVGDVATTGRMAIVLFAHPHDVKPVWLRLLSDQVLWGR
jgi:hypothetical protein